MFRQRKPQHDAQALDTGYVGYQVDNEVHNINIAVAIRNESVSPRNLVVRTLVCILVERPDFPHSQYLGCPQGHLPTLRIPSEDPMWIVDAASILRPSTVLGGNGTPVVRTQNCRPANDQNTWRCKACFGEDIDELHEEGDSRRFAGEFQVVN
jgi:hypothetical protein